MTIVFIATIVILIIFAILWNNNDIRLENEKIFAEVKNLRYIAEQNHELFNRIDKLAHSRTKNLEDKFNSIMLENNDEKILQNICLMAVDIQDIEKELRKLNASDKSILDKLYDINLEKACSKVEGLQAGDKYYFYDISKGSIKCLTIEDENSIDLYKRYLKYMPDFISINKEELVSKFEN